MSERSHWVVLAIAWLTSCGLDRSGLLEAGGGVGGTSPFGGAGGSSGSGGTSRTWPDGSAGSGGTLPTGGGGSAGAPPDGGDADAPAADVGLDVNSDTGDGGDGAVSWKPTEIPNCVLWLDAADSASLSLTGSTVQAWTDKCAATPVTSTANSKPVYVPALQNGLGALRFDGADDFMEIGGTPKVAPALVLFAVCVHRSPTLPAAPIWSNRQLLAVAGATPTYFGLASQRPFLYQNMASQPSLQGQKALGTNPHLVELAIGTAGRQLLVDGVLDVSDLVATGTATALPSGILGADLPNAWYGAVDLFEVVAYDRELTATERGAIRTALKAKWALP